MSEINLLTGADVPKENTYKTASKLKKILVLFLFVFVLVAAASVGVVLYNQNKISLLNQDIESLRGQVNALSDVETNYIIAKNRAGYIDNVLGDNSVYKGVQALRSAILAKDTVEVVSINMQRSDAKLGLLLTNIGDVRSVLSFLLQQEYYNNANVSSLTYVPGTGYELSLDLFREQDVEENIPDTTEDE